MYTTHVAQATMPYTVQRTHTRTHGEWCKARAAHADHRTHTQTHIQDTLLALPKPNIVPHVHTRKCSTQAQYKFWPYTPPGRKYAAMPRPSTGTVHIRTALARTNEHARPFMPRPRSGTVHMRTALTRTNTHARPFIFTWPPQPTRSLKPNEHN